MDRFPESEIQFKRGIVFAQVSGDAKHGELPEPAPEDLIEKYWTFKSQTGVTLNIHTDSMDISSTHHKTYSHQDEQDRFRDAIEAAVNPFLDLVPIPKIKRIGLRYIDECPVPARNTEAFCSYYNTTFPTGRFTIEDSRRMEFVARVQREDYGLVFREILIMDEEEPKLVLDTDAFGTDIEARTYLAVTDHLHELVVAEFKRSIREPVYEHMRAPKENR